MTKSNLTNQTRTSRQSSSRLGATVDTFLIHHQASTNDDETIQLMVTGARQVSANYTISTSGRLTSVVDESLRAWTSGSEYDDGRGAAWDRRAITVEIADETLGPQWKISDESLAKAAALLHDLKKRYKIKHVLGHRDLWDDYRASYSTYCPGPDTVAEIIKREAAIKPAPTAKTYKVADGDTLSEIAVRFKTTVAKLLALNPTIHNAALIYPGEKLRVK